MALVSSAQKARDEISLKRRLRSALRGHSFPGLPSLHLLESVEALGPVAVFGGMIRDLALSPPGDFKSDLDLVVDCGRVDLERVMTWFNASRNRFGGFRVHVGTRNVDLWSLNNTWAFENGYVSGGTFADLTRTTFFNWDAAVYDLSKSSLYYSPDYFDWLRNGILEINLEANANPAGNVRRALRSAFSGEAKLGPKLTKYVFHFLTLSECKRARLENYARYFSSDAVKEFAKILSRHLDQWPNEPFDFANTQLRLAIPIRPNSEGYEISV